MMNKNNATESIFNHITFYKDGSFLVNCGMQPNNKTIIISIVKPDTNVETCDHSAWLNQRKILGVKTSCA